MLQGPVQFVPSKHSAKERLNSWKEIAVYLQTSERTAQRWEKTEGLPVYRHVHDKLGSIYAYKDELEAWQVSRERKIQQEVPGVEIPSIGRETSQVRGRVWLGIVLGFLALASIPVWRDLSRRPIPQDALVVTPLTPGHESYPSFSPAGNQLAFSWDREDRGDLDIYVKPIGPGDPLRLTSNPADDLSPAFSPDGRYIAFLRRFPSSKIEVMIIPATGGTERELAEIHPLPNPEFFFGPYLTWSRDETWLIVIDKSLSSEAHSLYAISVETGEKQRLTFPPDTWIGDTGPAVSPDGRSVVFVRAEGSRRRNLYILTLSENFRPMGEPKRLAVDDPYVMSPVWAPDGSAIFFSSGEFRNRGLRKISTLAPGKFQPLASAGENIFSLAMSSDGRRLAFAQQSYALNIWRILLPGTSSGASSESKFISSARDQIFPQYSPDGNKIAFSSNRSGKLDIWVCDRDGSNAIQLTNSKRGLARAPTWSPDSRRISFFSDEGGQSDIYVIDAEGGEARRLTTSLGENSWPTWSRDGKWLYFASSRTGSRQIWKMPANGGEATQVTKGGGSLAFESPDGENIYYSKGRNNSSVWKASVDGNEEIRILESLADFDAFSVTHQGIYFVPASDGGEVPSVQFFDFATSTIKRIANMRGFFGFGLAVSPNGRWLLYTRHEDVGSNLMLVENLR